MEGQVNWPCTFAMPEIGSKQQKLKQIAHLQLACVSQARPLHLPAEFWIPSRAASAGLALPSSVPHVNMVKLVQCVLPAGRNLLLPWHVFLRLT